MSECWSIFIKGLKKIIPLPSEVATTTTSYGLAQTLWYFRAKGRLQLSVLEIVRFFKMVNGPSRSKLLSVLDCVYMIALFWGISEQFTSASCLRTSADSCSSMEPCSAVTPLRHELNSHSSIHHHLLLKTFQGRTFCIIIIQIPHVYFYLGHSVSSLADRGYPEGKGRAHRTIRTLLLHIFPGTRVP